MSAEAQRTVRTLEPIHVVLPLRSVSGGKARLGEALDAEEREELVLGLLLHSLSVLAAWPRCARIHLVSPDPVLAAATAQSGAPIVVHRQPGEGLNEGISLGLAAATADGAASVLVLPGDLPLLAEAALEQLVLAADAALAASGGGALVAIAPSDVRGGTNALLLHPPEVIAPCFGSSSLEAHLRAAESADAAVQVVDDPVLGFDLDTPDDLERLDPGRLRELMLAGRNAAERVGG
jgi:2-phospho-L-lactate/phosphoenolpyruvate guanylyltransferase